MIPKINSKTINEILLQSQQSISDIESDMNKVKSDITNKLLVIKNIQEYESQEVSLLKELVSEGINSDIKDKIVFANKDTNLDGKYNIFGSTIHQEFIKTPNNVFNFATSVGAIFKNNANVRINDEIDETAKAILMHDSINGKETYFKEYDSPSIKIEIELNIGDLLGDTKFNVIEIDPFILGSFTIDSFEIYTIQSNMTKSTFPDYQTTQAITKVGSSRIILDNQYNLYKCIFNITLKYKNKNGKYPFGLKHIYFLNADFNSNSYVVTKITKNKFIDWISDTIYIRDQNTVYESSCSIEGIKLYMSYNNGILEYEITPSKGLSKNITARNIKEIYVKVPLNKSMISLAFEKIADR